MEQGAPVGLNIMVACLGGVFQHSFKTNGSMDITFLCYVCYMYTTLLSFAIMPLGDVMGGKETLLTQNRSICTFGTC